jgi:hypothetical protein
MSSVLLTGLSVERADRGRSPVSYNWLHVSASRAGKE